MGIATLFRKQATPEIADQVDSRALDQLFRKARTHNGWQPIGVPDTLLKEAVELAKMGPTSANASPLRIMFVRSQEAKLRLKPALMPGNVDKTMAAPVTAITAHDTKFYELLPRLFPMPTPKPGSLPTKPSPTIRPTRMALSRSPISSWLCVPSGWTQAQ